MFPFTLLHSSKDGLRSISKSLGFGDSIDVRLASEHKGANAAVYAINMDFQVGIEMEDIIKGNDSISNGYVLFKKCTNHKYRGGHFRDFAKIRTFKTSS